MTTPRLLWIPRAVSILLAVSAAASAQFTPAPGSPFKAGPEPVASAVGDFNGDGNLDLAIVDSGDYSVTVLLGDGKGGFTAAPGSPFGVGAAPYFVAVGDFNGDGKLDLVTANESGSVTVLLGDGKGGLTESLGSPFPAGALPQSVAVGDFNGDGKLDLAIGNWGSYDVTVLLGNGAGGFTAAPGSPFLVGEGNLDFVAVGDFNGDGKLDLATASASADGITVLLGDGTGRFKAAPGSPLPVGGGVLAVGDLNGDGKLDLAIAGTSGNNVTVLLGNGAGGFTAAPGSPFPVGGYADFVAVVDFDGDGIPDLAIANYSDNTGSGSVTVLRGDGLGGFTAAPGSPFATGAYPLAVAVGDFNGDGRPDLATPNDDGTVTVLLNTTFTLLSPGSSATGVSLMPTLSWSASAGATSYDIYFGAEGCGMVCLVPPLVGSQTGTTYAPGTLSQNTSYHWRIVANSATGSTSSDTWGFTTTPVSLPPAPTLLLPADQATGVSLTPTLIWTASAGATSYDVHFGGACVICRLPVVSTQTGTSYTAGPLAPGAGYNWYVTANNAAGSTSSANWRFTTTPETVPTAPVLVSPGNGASGVSLTPTLTWNAASGAASYDIYFGVVVCSRLVCTLPPKVGTQTGTSFAPGTLNSGTTYHWYIVADNGAGSTGSAVWSFTTQGGTAPAPGLRFVPVTPCRIADTRNADGPFGGPTLGSASTRSFAVPQSACKIPATALAYSLNVTVVPEGPLGYLSLWPTGGTQPFVSTLNSLGGAIVANAAIVPAGVGGAVSVFVTDPSDVILDINGYFDTSTGATSYSFYPETPCRVADTRNPTGQFGGPTMYGGQTRDFPIPLSSCDVPAMARAYSLNVTVAPQGSLGYLSTWPTGQSQPLVSTLNSPNGSIVANAALVPAGTNESISVFVTNPTDVILDINGFFGAPGSENALSFFPVTPCRVADTRNATGPFGGPIMAGGQTRSFNIPASACSIPATAAAYSLNVTVVPNGPLGYLSAWPAGATQPLVSTLNSNGGSVLANAAIVPAGPDGAIDIYVTNQTHVILDINGYFAAP